MLNFDAVLLCSHFFLLCIDASGGCGVTSFNFSFINVPLPWGAFAQFFFNILTTAGGSYGFFNAVSLVFFMRLLCAFFETFAWALISPCLCVHFLLSGVLFRFLRY